MPAFADTDLNCELVFDRSLVARDLDIVQELLAALAPKWAGKLRIWKGPKDQIQVDLANSGDLGAKVMATAGERGPTYRALVRRDGAPPFERFSGSVELRGAGPELVVVVSIDEMVVSPLGNKRQLGNCISLQVRRSKVAGMPGALWARQTFEQLCCRLSPVWGWAGQPAEYWAKVMTDTPRIEAIGRDFGRFLPGLFWLNFFGERYGELIGPARLNSVPADEAKIVDRGTLVVLNNDPTTWDTPEYFSVEETIRNHLGASLFFLKSEPDRLTFAPEWDI